MPVGRGGRRGNTEKRIEAQTIMYKISYNDILYNIGNTVNIL